MLLEFCPDCGAAIPPTGSCPICMWTPRTQHFLCLLEVHDGCDDLLCDCVCHRPLSTLTEIEEYLNG
jgi:hypothetical protein